MASERTRPPTGGMGAAPILLVEPEGAAGRVLQLLEEGAANGDGAVVTAGRLDEALGLLRERTFRAVVVDLDVADKGGVPAAISRLQLASPLAPIVALSSTDDEALAAQALALGAQDCLPLDQADARVLARALRHAVLRRAADQRLVYLAHHDQLSGLANRTLFRERLGRAIASAQRAKGNVAILLLDLDEFREVNDTLGHDTGDALLRQVAERLRAGTRETDTVARLGGDEFALILTGMPRKEDASVVAERIRRRLAEPLVLAGRPLAATASIGVATYPDDAADIEGLMKCAELAMYQAKSKGRDNYQFYDRAMTARAADRLALIEALRGAVEREEFLLHYQPLIELRTSRAVGVEALIRWRKDGALVPPLKFIPALEETGLIVPVGEWVIRTAARQARRWAEAGLPALRVAINLSPRQFRQQSLAERIAELLRDEGLPAEQLEVELTEGLVMEDSAFSVKALATLKEMGVRVSIDDFGTGYSSLAYLKRFPLDTLKIDRAFVKDLPGDPDNAVIVRAVIGLAHNLRLQVLAEGVETEEQSAFLRASGCDDAQGYFFGKPVDAEECARLLRGAPDAA